MGEMTNLLKEVVEYLAKLSVDRPEEVEVKTSMSTKSIIIQIRVHESDCGKIIGKQGRSIDSMKVQCLNIKNTQYPEDSRRIMLEVLEDEDAEFSYK
jgi:hypothetical protein